MAKWRFLIGLFSLILVACGLRFLQLGAKSLWFDEGYSAWITTLDVPQIIQVIRRDVSPPLYYLCLKGWVSLVGDGEAGLRSMSAVAACLAMGLVSAVAWRITRERLATLGAAAVFGVSVLQIQYAQEARSYGLASLLAALALYGMVRRLEGVHGWLALMLVAAGASVWLHNMMWFYLAGLNLAYLAAPGVVRLRRRVAELAVLDGAVALAYWPWVPALLGQMQWLKGNFWAPVPTLVDLGHVLAAVGGIKLLHVSAILPFAWLPAMLATVTLGGVVILSLRGKDRRRTRWAVAILLFGLLPILAVFAHARFSQSYFVEKVFTASTLTMPLLVAIGIQGCRRGVGGALTAAMVGVILAASMVSVWGYFHWEPKEQWRDAAAYLNTFPREGTLVVFVANEPEYLYDYYTRQAGLTPLRRTGSPQSFFDLYPPRTIQRVLTPGDTQKLVGVIQKTSPQRVLLVSSHTAYSDPNDYTRAMIAGRMIEGSVREFPHIQVREYLSRGAPGATRTP